eukprot:2338842-Prymnesium_polylepis.2
MRKRLDQILLSRVRPSSAKNSIVVRPEELQAKLQEAEPIVGLCLDAGCTLVALEGPDHLRCIPVFWVACSCGSKSLRYIFVVSKLLGPDKCQPFGEGNSAHHGIRFEKLPNLRRERAEAQQQVRDLPCAHELLFLAFLDCVWNRKPLWKPELLLALIGEPKHLIKSACGQAGARVCDSQQGAELRVPHEAGNPAARRGCQA